MLSRKRQMHYLVTIAEEGQLTAAARRLKVAQPALSQAISQMEAELGVELLERKHRGVKLTPAGAAFLLKARVALAAEADAVQTAEALARAHRGEITIGFVGPPPAIITPQPFAALSESHPQAQVSFRDLPFPHGATRAWLADVDVAFSHPPESEAGLDIQPVRTEPRAVVAQRSHRLAGRKELAVTDVLDETFVSYHRDVQRRWAGFHSLDDHRGAAPEHTTKDHAFTSLEMLGIISTSPGITTVPYADAKLAQRVVPHIAAIPLHDANPAVVSLTWRRDNQNPLITTLVSAVLSLGDVHGV
jgi:DNA-binding transcriptional LysR family regulator